VNKETFRKRALELESEVKAKTADLEADKITTAEFSDFMEKAHAESESLQTGSKNYERALAFRAGNDLTQLPERQQEKSVVPTVIGDETPMTRKQFGEAYGQLKDAAARRIPNSSFMFDFGLKSRDYSTVIKTQGETGLQGEAAEGTTTPSPLGANDYFLTGPAGPDILPQFIPGILELRWYQNVIGACFPTFPTSSPVVSYVRETAWDNQSAATNEGATFPTSTNAIQRYTEQIGKVTNLVRMTDEMIQDDNYFQALIQKRATQGVSREEEVQLLAGSGYPGINGILNRTDGFTKPQTVTALSNLDIPTTGTAGLGARNATVASVTPGREIVGTSTGVGPDGAQIAIGVLSALTDIRTLHFFEPTHILMNPADWFTVRTWQDNNGQFLAGSPFMRDYGRPQDTTNPAVQAVDTQLDIWGKNVVTTPAMPQGLILVGDCQDAGQVLRRGGLRVEMVNTNGTDFENGLWTMRAYSRVGLVIERPELFELIKLSVGA
jgi:HK97 family phage major capsid protein